MKKKILSVLVALSSLFALADYTVSGTDGWGDSGTWQGRPLVLGASSGSNPNQKHEAMIVLPEDGKITATGNGSYLVGTKVTFKAASTEKGAVFLGWYDEGGHCVSTSVSFVFTMPAANVAYSPRFVLPFDDYLQVYVTMEELLVQPGKNVDGIVGTYDSRSEVSAKPAGLPSGLKLELTNGNVRVYGKVAQTAKPASGWVTVAFNNQTGYKQTVYIPYAVGAAECPYADRDQFSLGSYYDEDWGDFKSVSGLPAGLKFDAKTRRVSGTPSKIGIYTIKGICDDGEISAWQATVEDPGSTWLNVGVYEGRGTVTGQGVYAAGTVAKISAKPDKGYYFAGWYCMGTPCKGLSSGGYLAASDSLVVLPYGVNNLEARFVTAAQDAHPYLESGWRWTIDTADLESSRQFVVSSVTKPTVTAKNLPAGVRLVVDDLEGGCLEVYDRTKLKPGTNEVQFLLKNVSGATAAATATVIVKPFPKLSLSVDPTGKQLGAKVTGSGAFLPYSKVTLKTTTPKGYVFAGWVGDCEWSHSGGDSDYRNPACVIAMPGRSTAVTTRFVLIEEDYVKLNEDKCFETLALATNEDVGEINVADLVGLESVSLPKFTVADLPAGLKFDAKTGLITGKVAKPKANFGAFTVTVNNAGGYQAAVAVPYSIDYEEDPAEKYLPDFFREAFDEAGYQIEGNRVKVMSSLYMLVNLGEYATSTRNETAPGGYKMQSTSKVELSVSGLPAGIKLTSTKETKSDKWSENGSSGNWSETVTRYCLTGVPTKPGRYTVVFTLKDTGSSSETGAQAEKWNNVEEFKLDLYVGLGASRYVYINVAPDPDGLVHGKVASSGVYAAGAAMNLSATADKDYVFAGWYLDQELTLPADCVYNELVLGKESAYTVADATWFIGDIHGRQQMPAPFSLWARFIPKQDDALVEILVNCDEVWKLVDQAAITIEAQTLTPDGARGSHATMTGVKGLPKGMTVTKQGGVINGIEQTGPVQPGYYELELSAKNLSSIKATRKITLLVEIEPNEFLQKYGLDQSDIGYMAQVGAVEYGSDASGLEALAAFANKVSDDWLAVSFTGLPAGLTLKSSTRADYSVEYSLDGTPTKPGTYTVTAKVSGSGWSETGYFFLTVLPLPDAVIGTFNGFVLDVDGNRNGSLVATVSSAGAISAKVTTAAGTESFSAKRFDYAEGGACHVLMKSASGSTLAFSLSDSGSGFGAFLEGAYGAEEYELGAVGGAYGWRNEHGAGGFFSANKQAAANLKALAALGMAYFHVAEIDADSGDFYLEEGTVKGYAVKLAFSAKGTVVYSGTIGGAKVSGVATINAEEYNPENLRFDLVCFDGKQKMVVFNALANVVDGKVEDIVVNGKVSISAPVIVPSAPSKGGVQLWAGGPYWAECNLGASKPEECGYYFWWGDTIGYKRHGGSLNGDIYENVTWVSSKGVRGEGSPFNSDCPTYDLDEPELFKLGYVDEAGNLVTKHDAASMHLGAPWRMPTMQEMEALESNCDVTWTTHNGVYGRLVKGKGDFSDKSIFLPAAGYGFEARLSHIGSIGVYWTSTLDTIRLYYAGRLSFDSEAFTRDNYYRYRGQPIRPIRGADE